MLKAQDSSVNECHGGEPFVHRQGVPQFVHKFPALNGTGFIINPLKAELNPICFLLALLGAHHFLHVSRIRVKSLTLRLLMSYIIYIYDII